ncbi:MAG: FtsH protease activity modulator HflK, partial [Candidatus Scalindua sp. AMX11]
YEKEKDVTRRRLYLETMAKVLPECEEIYIIDKDQKGLLPFLNLGESKLPQ